MYSQDDQDGLSGSSSIQPKAQSDRGHSRDSSINKKPRLTTSNSDHQRYIQTESGTRAELQLLASELVQALEEPVTNNDAIKLCGSAPLEILSTRPDDILTLAYDKLSTWPFHEVPTCWRRLYEDASLFKAIDIIRSEAATDVSETGAKRKRLNPTANVIDLLVAELDKGLTISGAPGRKDVFEFAFQYLSSLVTHGIDDHVPRKFYTDHQECIESSEYGIKRAEKMLSFDMFQNHMDTKAQPLIIPNAIDHWPATKLWQDPRYLLRLTLGGRRLVPVEIGRSYTDEEWSQRAMPFSEFMQTYLLPENPPNIGYLAQHDLFAQIPALRKDIAVPDYCFTAPAATDQSVQKTAGLSGVKKLDAPLLNAWLGPRGTKTPLHTDTYHNILCQVVGYKYVRLYAPEETTKVYPRGVDEKGISMENTSRVDISFVRPKASDGTIDTDTLSKAEVEFPMFSQAKYQEAILGPGECLYIPLGWWHYVESVSTSFSVSFWWN